MKPTKVTSPFVPIGYPSNGLQKPPVTEVILEVPKLADSDSSSSNTQGTVENLRNCWLSKARALDCNINNASEEFIIQQVTASVQWWAEKVADDIGISPLKLKILLPEVISLDQFAELKSDSLNKNMKKFSKRTLKNIVSNSPIEVRKKLSTELLEYAFPNRDVPKPSNVSIADTCDGAYTPEYHKIPICSMTAEHAKIGCRSIGAHEANHAVNALLRSLLSKEKLKKALVESLQDEIKFGTTSILSMWEITELPYLPQEELREELAEFLGEIALALEGRDERLIIQTYRSGEFVWKIERVSTTGKGDLLKIAKKYKAFIELFDNEDDAILVLASLIEIQLSRFNLALGKHNNPLCNELASTINESAFCCLSSQNVQELKREIENSPKAMQFAMTSAKDFLQLINSFKFQLKKRVGSDPTFSDMVDYFFCPEEASCNLASFQALSTEPDIPNLEQMLQELALYFESGKEYFSLQKHLRITLQDSKLVRQENKLRISKIKYFEILWKINNLMEENILPIAESIPQLKPTLEEEARYGALINVSLAKMDKTKLTSEEHDEYHFYINKLRSTRLKIVDLLMRLDILADKVKELKLLLEEEGKIHEELKHLEPTLDERCLDPRKRVIDTTILDKIDSIEGLIKEKLENMK